MSTHFGITIPDNTHTIAAGFRHDTLRPTPSAQDLEDPRQTRLRLLAEHDAHFANAEMRKRQFLSVAAERIAARKALDAAKALPRS